MSLLYGKSSPDVQSDKTKSLAATLCESMLKHPKERICSVDALSKDRLTYNDVLTSAIDVARHFRSLGVTKGSVVAFMVENTIQMGGYLLGTLFLEAIYAPLNPTFTFYELEQICTWLQPKIIVCNSTSMTTVQEVQKLKESCPFQIVDASELFIKHDIDVQHETSDFNEFFSADTLPEDPVMLVCSSGTTGLPKGVLHSNNSMLTVLDFLADSQIGARDTDVILGYLPFYHVMGIFSLLGTLYIGQKLIVLQKFKPHALLNSVEEFKVNKMYLVPTVCLFLAQFDAIADYDLSTLEEMICAGSTLSKTTYDAVRVKLPHCVLRVAYGMSELNYTTITRPSCEYNGSVGNLMPGCVGKVIDPETSEILPAHKTGELCIYSKAKFLGYYRNEEETLNTMDAEGFVRTGDVVYYNEDADVFVVGRIKELIKHKSFQVSPVELEAILLQHDAVADVGVIGVPDERCGELPRAYVALKSDVDASRREHLRKELQEFVAKHVTSYKQLSGGVYFVREIPKNASGKILRHQLKSKCLVEE